MAARLLALICLLCVAACGLRPARMQETPAATLVSPSATPSTTGPAPRPTGYQPIGGPAQGVSVAVPSTWVVVNLTSGQIEDGLRKAGLGQNTQLIASARRLKDANAAFAADRQSTSTSKNGFATNVSAFCQPGSPTIATLKEGVPTGLKRVRATNIRVTQTMANGRAALKVTYDIKIGALALHGTQFYVPGDGKACIVAMATDQDGYGKVFDEIGSTIQLT